MKNVQNSKPSPYYSLRGGAVVNAPSDTNSYYQVLDGPASEDCLKKRG